MITNATAAAAMNHWCADSMPLARPGSDCSRNTLSVQFGPTIRVEEWISYERQRERSERGLKIDSEDQRLSGRAAEAAAWGGENQVHQKREDETGREHADAAEQRRAVVPANPDRREPDEAGKDGKIANPPNRSKKRCSKAGQNQRDASTQGEGCGDARVSGIGGVAALGLPQWLMRPVRRRVLLARQRAVPCLFRCMDTAATPDCGMQPRSGRLRASHSSHWRQPRCAERRRFVASNASVNERS